MNYLRDTREKSFLINDEYLNGYAKLCGINATGVYVSLCRHANKKQTCFPSKRLIAEELSISERSVYTALKKLEEWNIVKVEEQGRKEDGSFRNKIYTLINKDSWKKKPPQANRAVGKKRHSPQANDDTHRRQQVPNKETHIEGNTYKDLATQSVAGKEINILLGKFQLVNPSFEKLFNNTTQRAALERLVKKYSFEKVEKMISELPEIVGRKYAPRVSTPLQLEDKLGDILIFLKQNKKTASVIKV